MTKRWDIIGLGAVAVDDLVYLNHYPQPNEKMSINKKQRQGGGLTATAMVAAARQGARSAYWGQLGEDDLSVYSLQELEREGVDTSLSHQRAGAKPFHSIILVDMTSASRVILYDSEGVEELDVSVITENLITSCRLLFIDHFAYKTGLLAAGFAHAYGIPVVADIESINLPDLNRFLGQIDHLIVGIDIASAITHKQSVEDMVRALSNPRRASCVVTAGAEGCWYSEYGGPVQHCPAYQVDVVDTTGCGDVFHGTYAAAIVRGESLSRAIHVASASAAIKATCCGGREGIPSLAAVEEFLKINR